MMSDILSAASLLTAVIAILYSLWYPELTKATEVKVAPHKQDNAQAYSDVKGIFMSKAIPLIIMAFIVGLIFTPDAIKIISETIIHYKQNGLAGWQQYDAVRTAYCFVWLFSWVLAFYVGHLAFKVFQKWRKLKP